MPSGLHRYIQPLAIVSVALLLAACGTMRSSVMVEPAAGSTYARAPGRLPARAQLRIPGGSYTVVKGDTLYSIAFRNGVDFRNLAQWNGVAQPYTIWPGQRLTLSPRAASTANVAAAASSMTANAAGAPSTVPAAPVFKPVSKPVVTAAAPRPGPVVSAPLHSPAPAPGAAATTNGAAALVPVAGVPPPVPSTLPPPATPASGVSRSVSGVNWRWPADGKLSGRFKSSDAIPGIEIAGKAGDAVRAAADGVVVYSGNGLVGYGELVIIKHNDSFLSAYGHNRKRLVKEGQRISSGQEIAEMGSTGASSNELEFQIRRNGNPVDPLDYLPSR
ncbi:MAG: peptidoglycan DD-metalloendopeptidase family protein [Pseudomonadota bacterium]|nr:peptidoglycan DD-metalloendopeptidase family protein [Pseudomonadota bacterium]